VYGLGWREFDILEPNGFPRQMVLDRLLHAEVIYVEGGNHYHLARSITGNGLADGFLKALEDRVYVGVSAGSMILAGISASAPSTSWGTSRTCTSSA